MEAIKEPTSKRKKLIDARVAAQAASAYFSDLYPNVSSFSLEEVELSDDGNHWQITLGFDIADGTGMVPFPFRPPKTKFKVFKVDAHTGKVLAMKIRKLE